LIGGPDRGKFFGTEEPSEPFGAWYHRATDSQLVAVPVPTSHNLGR
jgi:hypothetical protein